MYQTFDEWFLELENYCLRAERFYEEAGSAELLPWLKAAFEAGASQVAAKQAVIDRLMMEFCPGEMTDEQWSVWMKHQRAVEN